MSTVLEQVQVRTERKRWLAHDVERDGRAVPTLFRRAHAGDAEAREALIRRFMPLARNLARRYRQRSEPFDDLVQVAALGLVKAVDRFDPERDIAFSTYAVPTILGELKRHFRDTSWAVHVPRSLYERALEVEQAGRVLANRDGREPSVVEIADHMEEDVESVLAALEAAQAHDALSLDATFDRPEGEAETLGATIGSVDDRYEYIEERAAVAECLDALTERERRVLELRFGAEMKQTEIAARVGISQMQVSRILRRTLARLRELADAEPPTA